MKHALIILLTSATVACGQVQYAFTNFAGMPGGPGSVDGHGSAARFSRPWGVAVDSTGNVYVAHRSPARDPLRQEHLVHLVAPLPTRTDPKNE